MLVIVPLDETSHLKIILYTGEENKGKHWRGMETRGDDDGSCDSRWRK